MRWGLLLALVIAVSLAGCTQGQSPQVDDSQAGDSDTPADTGTNASGDNTIVFTGSGFQPASLTVEQGETVTWVNQADTSMWVASDRHPTHTLYDGSSRSEHCDGDSTAFDQCGTGDRYSFTFEKTGEWGYHNHVPFVQGGTITVE